MSETEKYGSNNLGNAGDMKEDREYRGNIKM